MKHSYNRNNILQQHIINKRIARVHFQALMDMIIRAPKSSVLLALVFDRLAVSRDRRPTNANHFAKMLGIGSEI